MTDEEFAAIRPVIEMAHRLHAKLDVQLIDRGVAPIDALIASIYSSHQLATKLHGNSVAAIEWMRDTLDTIERQALAPR